MHHWNLYVQLFLVHLQRQHGQGYLCLRTLVGSLHTKGWFSSTILQFISSDFTKLQAKISSILQSDLFFFVLHFCSAFCPSSKKVEKSCCWFEAGICSVFPYYSSQLIFLRYNKSWTGKYILKRLSNAIFIAPLTSNSLSTWERLKTLKNVSST